MILCVDCARQATEGSARCYRCEHKALPRNPRQRIGDFERSGNALMQLTQLYLMDNIEVPRQIARHPNWTDEEIVGAAVKSVNALMPALGRLTAETSDKAEFGAGTWGSSPLLRRSGRG